MKRFIITLFLGCTFVFLFAIIQLYGIIFWIISYLMANYIALWICSKDKDDKDSKE